MPNRLPPLVFISHSSADAEIARAVCHALEANAIGCWIAPRDVTAGMPYGESILQGLDGCQLVVVVLSANANASTMVDNEIERAASRKRPFLVLRIEDVRPGRGTEFFLSKSHWFDAFLLGYRAHLDSLVEAAQRLLAPGTTTISASADAPRVDSYLGERGPDAHRDFTLPLKGEIDRSYRGVQQVEELYHKLKDGKAELEAPIEITVRGTLFPCALLSSGYFERKREARARHMEWKNGLQKWLFHGFDQWAPSWDFTWDFENWHPASARPCYIAQLGSNDEADSIPVLVPSSKALKLRERFKSTWGGIEAEITADLGHRKHFNEHIDADTLELFGGLLNYCLRISEDNPNHRITQRAEKTEIYSGYIWKCVAPNAFLRDGVASLTDMFFIWEHVNFASKDALDYGLESMVRKEEYIQKECGPLTLIQKSSDLVPNSGNSGEAALSAREIYNMLLRGRVGDDI